MYRLSKKTGVPYTVINELVHEKKDINRCSVETVVRLAAGLSAGICDLLDPISGLDGVSGTYRKIRYKWVADKTMKLHLYDKGKEHIIVTKYRFNNPKYINIYREYTEFFIDDYLKTREFNEKADMIEKKMPGRPDV